jgi:hypothetical protein
MINPMDLVAVLLGLALFALIGLAIQALDRV